MRNARVLREGGGGCCQDFSWDGGCGIGAVLGDGSHKSRVDRQRGRSGALAVLLEEKCVIHDCPGFGAATCSRTS